MSVAHPDSLPRRLRAYLAETATKLPPHKDFWKRIREILGAQPAQQETVPLEGSSIQRRSAEDWVGRAGEADAACARRGLRYVLAATALTSRVDGVERPLSAQALAMRAARIGFNAREGVGIRPVEGTGRPLHHGSERDGADEQGGLDGSTREGCPLARNLRIGVSAPARGRFGSAAAAGDMRPRAAALLRPGSPQRHGASGLAPVQPVSGTPLSVQGRDEVLGKQRRDR
ncbi:hypothetical protein ABB37_10143 [Leptomonas pyrrhocoris]|uniref:Uncharacterized protein n=1 Tax=Leptomonas pyrrhocoris TaxID=157538 RepID=A0A0N0VCJ4_LEPPY|nr:hypothetical protein ABB37_10143 [Leptomonas pyrrhocoris]KPA73071.1 hypothetical protein ABB37_10143 [Leptomonas pyrrhocoris]|eukprot:XP_015651510.1 hypothetical protein ABB37_10143 [Leptomonas pyrrhocoris]